MKSHSSPIALILDVDGKSICTMTLSEDNTSGENEGWKIGEKVHIFKSISKNDKYLEMIRVLFLSDNTLIYAAFNNADASTHLIIGGKFDDEINENSVNSSITSKCMFNSKSSRTRFDVGEAFFSLTELPSQPKTDSYNIAVVTNHRIMIYSVSSPNSIVLPLTILAQTNVQVTCAFLAPIGSHCVAFTSAISCHGNSPKLSYLSCLANSSQENVQSRFKSGIIATLPICEHDISSFLLLAIRPDRFVYIQRHCGVRVVESRHEENSVLIPVTFTRPALMLEPLIVNALCQVSKGNTAQSDKMVQSLLQSIIERFGRKLKSNPHGSKEGVGVLGAGITSTLFSLLKDMECYEAASQLLMGYELGSTSSIGKALPPWVPAMDKAFASNSCENALKALVGGDNLLSEYLGTIDSTLEAPAMPRPTDPTSIFSRYLASNCTEDNILDIARFLDLSGSPSSDITLLQIILSMQLDPNSNTDEALLSLCGRDYSLKNPSERRDFCSVASSLAALSLDLHKRQGDDGKVPLKEGEFEKIGANISSRWMRQLAPTFQRGLNCTRRPRNCLSGRSLEKTIIKKKINPVLMKDQIWKSNFYETKHVWHSGPFDQKEEILLLDRTEEWLGRRKPTILGKEGVELDAECGERTLADILAAADKDNDDKKDNSDSDTNSFKEGWVDGIGEGRTDELNLVLYMRFSEGGDEDSNWIDEGLTDLSSFKNKTKIISPTMMAIEATTSYVDEGESGKVKLLYDIVFKNDIENDAKGGLMVEVRRGSSLDIGMLHNVDNQSRQRCTIEFWFYLPRKDIGSEIILARRSVCFPSEDIDNLCSPSEIDSMMWELALLPSGRLEFRSCSRSSFKSSYNVSEMKSGQVKDYEDESDEEEDPSLVSWPKDGYGGWNHVCLIFSCRDSAKITECQVSMLMKGVNVGSSIISIEPPGLENDQLCDIDEIDEALERTALIFGVGGVSGLRFTEIRCWACQRSNEDVKNTMYECLSAAETKKKFKVKIRKKGTPSTTGALLAPPKISERNVSSTSATGALLAPPKISVRNISSTSIAPPESSPARKRRGKHNLKVEEESPSINDFKDNAFTNDAKFEESKVDDLFQNSLKDPSNKTTDKFIESFNEDKKDPSNFFFDSHSNAKAPSTDKSDNNFFSSTPFSPGLNSPKEANDKIVGNFQSSFSIQMFESSLLSKQVRSSAAAAIVRGPPATRHFGGNRGGLPKPLNEPTSLRKNGVSSIAICGSEKTVVYTPDTKSPKGKTYPIGASGAIISDVMDSAGSEYLCCFLAKDKRLVVFELLKKNIIVELQMTTKLNFWRFLPPMTHGETLVFMMITPVGGFHWMPLEASPRPQQVWKRTLEIQSKKIVSYEEGGSNGLTGYDRRSTVALLLTSDATTGALVEAWCLQLHTNSSALLLSSDVVGAALFCPSSQHINGSEFQPNVIVASKDQDQNMFINMFKLSVDETKILTISPNPEASIAIDSKDVGSSFPAPSMAMGNSPTIFCLCHNDHVIILIRSTGILFSYTFSNNSFHFNGKRDLGKFIIDAAVKRGRVENEVEVVILLSEGSGLKDGRIVTVSLRDATAEIFE